MFRMFRRFRRFRTFRTSPHACYPRTKAGRLQPQHQSHRSKALAIEIVILPTMPSRGPKKYVRELSEKKKTNKQKKKTEKKHKNKNKKTNKTKQHKTKKYKKTSTK